MSDHDQDDDHLSSEEIRNPLDDEVLRGEILDLKERLSSLHRRLEELERKISSSNSQ